FDQRDRIGRALAQRASTVEIARGGGEGETLDLVEILVEAGDAEHVTEALAFTGDPEARLAAAKIDLVEDEVRQFVIETVGSVVVKTRRHAAAGKQPDPGLQEVALPDRAHRDWTYALDVHWRLAVDTRSVS